MTMGSGSLHYITLPSGCGAGMLLLALFMTVLAGTRSAVVAPSWADPRHNPCAAQPGGWQLILWPEDGRCYRIFRRGHPCPPTMELSPGVGPKGAPGCRCPPWTAQFAQDSLCHPLLEQGPCPKGQYFAPAPASTTEPSQDRVPRQWGACREPEICPSGEVFWPKESRCYPRLTRGPCYRGELLVSEAGLGVCRCEPRGELSSYYFAFTKTCHEHFTPGPCQEKGQLFLPGGRCGCHKDLPHYHPDTGHCYQIDTIGPCPVGHRFSPLESRTGKRATRALCQCKEGHVSWITDGGCYRPWTRGPCEPGQLLTNASTCVSLPCRSGRLYFPDQGGCYKVGVRGPCPKGQVVLFEASVRPAVEGISYKGICGCSGPNARSSSNDIPGKVGDDNRCGVSEDTELSARDLSGEQPVPIPTPAVECDAKSGSVLFNRSCQTLYKQGPCPHGQWLVPARRARGNWDLWTPEEDTPRARCDCKPGYKPVPARSNGTLDCQPPSVLLASFLNSHGFAGS